MPRKPETHAKLADVLKAEEALPIDRWVKELAAVAEPHDYACPAYRAPKRPDRLLLPAVRATRRSARPRRLDASHAAA